MQTNSRTERKALAGFLAVLVVGFIIYWAIGARLSKTMLDDLGPFDYQAVRYIKKHMKPSRTDNSSILLSLGDSTASRNLLISHLFLEVRALNVLGGSLIEPTFFLRDYLKDNPAPECAVIMTSYGALESHYKKFFWNVLIRFGFYDEAAYVDLLKTSRQYGEYPGAMLTPYEAWLNFYFKYNAQWIDFSLVQSRVWDPKTEQKARRRYRFLRRNRGTAPISIQQAFLEKTKFIGDNHLFLQSEFKVNKTLDHYIREMLTMLRDSKTAAIFLLPPMAESARTPASEKWVRDYQNHMRSILIDFPSTKEMLEPQWFADNRFVDLNHLSSPWAKEYTLQMRDEIEACRGKRFKE